jgi:hypothetical protein
MDTDYSVRNEVDRIRARVSKVMETDGGSEEVQTWLSVFSLSDDPPSEPGTHGLPATFGILADDSDLDREIVIELEALASGSDQALVSRRVKTGFVRGEARLVRVLLYRACAGVQCMAGETCGCADAMSCAAPTCIDETVPPEDLESIDDPGVLPPDAGIPILDAGVPDGSVPPDDGGTEPDAAVPDGGGITCGAPLTICGLECVNIQADPRYCGDCDTSCATGYICDLGTCFNPGDCRTNGTGCSGFTYCDAATGECLRGCADASRCTGENEACDTLTHECVCTAGFHLCGVTCVSDLDVNSCGTSCIPCPAPPNSTPRCVAGACDFVCAETYERCDLMCCPTSCPSGQVLYNRVCAQTHVQVADDLGSRGEHTSIALDAIDSAHIGYYAKSGGDLIYAAQQADSSWVSQSPDGPDDVGQYASIAFDPAGVLHIAYRNANDKDLMLATQQSRGIWTVEVVDGNGDVGEHASLAFDASGAAHISYYDKRNRDLMYATRPGGGAWTVQTVDIANDVGEYSSLALDASGAAHISYYDKSNKDLKYASQLFGGIWTWQTVASVGDVGKYTSLAIDGTGAAHVSYYGESTKDLLYATEIAPGLWTTETIESQGDVGMHTSLAMDAAGAARLSYYDEVARDLKYAIQLPNKSWAVQVVDSVGDVGTYTSIAVDSLGHAHISYYDASASDLKYALIAAPE